MRAVPQLPVAPRMAYVAMIALILGFHGVAGEGRGDGGG